MPWKIYQFCLSPFAPAPPRSSRFFSRWMTHELFDEGVRVYTDFPKALLCPP
jgi:hypothetical protein